MAHFAGDFSDVPEPTEVVRSRKSWGEIVSEQDMGPAQRLIPAHLRPQNNTCVIQPVRRTYVCTEFGTDEYVEPGKVVCSCGQDHEANNPFRKPLEWQEVPEHVPGWTVQSANRPPT